MRSTAVLSSLLLACGSRSAPPTAEPTPTHEAPAASAPDAAPGQTFAEGIQAFCSAPERVADRIEAEPQRKATILALEVRRSVTNEEARAAIARIGALEPAAKADYLRGLLARARLERCPIVEALEATKAQ